MFLFYTKRGAHFICKMQSFFTCTDRKTDVSTGNSAEKYRQNFLGCDGMKRLVTLFLCLVLLNVPAKAEEKEKLVALTFDDGPSGRFTQKLLDGLEERGARATFLLCGYRMAQYPQLTERIYGEGHEIGLHGYSHKPMQTMALGEIRKELQQALALVPTGCRVAFLRSPGGLYSPNVLTAAGELGISVLHWSVDPKDWATHDVQAVETQILDRVRDGDIILLHDMSDSSVEAALMIVDQLQAQGYRFVTASQLAQARGLTLIPGKKYSRF